MMQLRQSLTAKPKAYKTNKNLKTSTNKPLRAQQNESIIDLSDICIDQDLSLLSHEPIEQISLEDKDFNKYFNIPHQQNKFKGRQSLTSKMDRNVTFFDKINYEKCLLHGKVADLICLKDRTIVCCNCALFGEHKGHQVINLEGLLAKLTSFTEECLEKYESLKELQSEFNEESFETRCREILMKNKQQERQKISSHFQQLMSAIKQAQKRAVMKLQSSYKQKLNKLTNIPQLNEFEKKIYEWYDEVEKLGQFIGDNEDLQPYINAIKYIDENGFGDKLLFEGQEYLEELKQLSEVYEEKLVKQSEKDKCQFNDQLIKQVENFCSFVQRQKEDNIKAMPEFEAPVKDDYLLASIVQQSEQLPSLDGKQIHFDNIPTLSISDIKVNTCTTNSDQSSVNCSSYVQKEQPEVVESKKRRKIEVGEKFKGIIEDIKNDRAETIDLTGAELGDNNVSGLCFYLRKTKKLRILKLTKNKLSDECLNELVMSLRQSRVTNLNLSQNNFTDKAISIFEKVVPSQLKITLTLNKINRRNTKSKIQALSAKGISILI